MSDIDSNIAMFAVISPPDKRTGRRWIDYTSVRNTARESRKHAGQYWPGGWADLLKMGYRVGKVDVLPHVAGPGMPE